MIPILPAGWGRGEGGLSLLSLWPGENKRTGGRIIIIKKGGLPSYLPTVWLASCRIRLNCFFILYFIFFFSALTPTGGNIPHYFSQYTTVRAPQRRSAKSNLPCLPSLIASRRRRSFFPAVTYFHLVYSNSSSPRCPLPACLLPAACAGMLDQLTAGTSQAAGERQQRQVAAAQRCSMGNVGKKSEADAQQIIQSRRFPHNRGL